MEAGGGGWGGWKGAEAAAPESRHCGAEGAGVGALLIAGESAEDARRELEVMPQGGRAQEPEAVAHGEFKGGGSRPVGIGTADGEDAARERGGGEEVEAAVEAGQGHSGLEVEGGEAQLEVEAGNCGEGDTEGGGEGFVELDLQLRAMGWGVEGEEVGQGVDGNGGVPESEEDGGRAVEEGRARAGASGGKEVMSSPDAGADELVVGVEG